VPSTWTGAFPSDISSDIVNVLLYRDVLSGRVPHMVLEIE
jgi:hypothetical protein